MRPGRITEDHALGMADIRGHVSLEDAIQFGWILSLSSHTGLVSSYIRRMVADGKFSGDDVRRANRRRLAWPSAGGRQ